MRIPCVINPGFLLFTRRAARRSGFALSSLLLFTPAWRGTADKYDYLHYLGEVIGDIASYTGLLKLSRDELYASAGTGKVDIQEHLSKIDGEIDSARRRIDNHFLDLRERLTASKPLATSEMVRAFERYALSKDTSVLPPIRQLYNALRKLREPTPEDTSTLADFIVALGRHIRSGAGYDCGLFDQFSITEVLGEMACLETGTANGPRLGGETAGKSGRRPVYTMEFCRLVQNTYEEWLAQGIGSKGAWNKAADTHGIKSGDAARVACARYLRPKTEQ